MNTQETIDKIRVTLQRFCENNNLTDDISVRWTIAAERIDANVGAFAASCYDNCSSPDSLRKCLDNGPDAQDMEDWKLTAEQWKTGIVAAMLARMED
jgi:hypothetical protein